MGWFDEDERRTGPPMAGGGPNSPTGKAIVSAMLNQPHSNLMSKGMSALGGFMQTSGMGGVAGGGGSNLGDVFSGMGGQTAAVPPPTPPPSLAETGPGEVAAPDAAAAQMPTLTSGAPTATPEATLGQRVQALQKALYHDPNQGARNMGRIAGVVARFMGY